MRKYILDQILFFVIEVLCIVGVYYYCGVKFTLLLCIVFLPALFYLCRRLLVLPLDLLLGKETKVVYFSKLDSIQNYDIFSKRHNVIWTFYYGNNSKLKLLVPISATKEELLNIKQPSTDDIVEVTYYRLSKILCSWNPSTLNR